MQQLKVPQVANPINTLRSKIKALAFYGLEICIEYDSRVDNYEGKRSVRSAISQRKDCSR